MDRCKCYLCERLCYCESTTYNECLYRKQRSFGCQENRAYEDACTRLAVRFARKHERKFEGWVGAFNANRDNWNPGCGGMAHIGEDVVSMEDIRTDLMMDAVPGAYWQYMDEQTEEYQRAEVQMRAPRNISYRSWLLGARHKSEHNTPEYNAMRKQELKEARQRLSIAKASLELELERMGKPARYNAEELQRYADELQMNSDGLF